MSLFRNKYRVESSRKPDWDYSTNATYFITICTEQKELYFGEIADGIMMLSDIGKIAGEFLMNINSHFIHVKTDCCIIMPNHIHAIIVLNKISGFAENVSPIANRNDDEDIFVDPLQKETLQCNASTGGTDEYMRSISPKTGSLPTIIRSYKSAVTKHAYNIDPDLSWQSGYHDHIIRNNNSYYTIRNYILNNPKNWKEDKFYL
jgi:putative transposase